MLLAATIFAIFLRISVAERSSLSRTYEYSETQMYTVVHSGQADTKLAYVRCNSSLPKLGQRCFVTLKLDAFENFAGETKECTVDLKLELPHGLVHNGMLVYVFGNDKVLLVWLEEQKASDLQDQMECTLLKTSVVHVFDSCRTFETKVYKYLGPPVTCTRYFDLRYINVILFDNTYELRVGDEEDDCTSRSKCDFNYRLYKFNDRGYKVCGSEHWPTPLFNGIRDYSFAVSAELPQPEEAYIIINRNETSLIVELMNIKASGYQKLQLWNYSCNSSLTELRWSMLNEAMGFCYVCANSIFVCWQSDQKGHIHTQFSLDIPRKTTLSAIYNLQNGGLLLAIPECSYPDCYSNSKYYFMEVDAKGNVNSVEVQFETKCHYDDNVSMRILENIQGQYCIVRLCQSKPYEPGRLDTSVRCYSSDEFSKCSICL